MAKLRRNHGSGRRGGSSSGNYFRVVVIFGVLLFAVFVLLPQLRGVLAEAEQPASTSTSERLYLPTGPSTQVIDHTYYSLGYEEDWEQARWVAYRLTPKQVRSRKAKRANDFRPDPLVRTGSAVRDDYRRSGYTRGHLVPAGDMSFDATAMSETFFYSNMSPQLAAHNGAVWRELEETVRGWVLDKGPMYIVSGPIIEQRPQRVGANDVAIPEAYYKVLLTESGAGIGFVIPHQRQTQALEAFAHSIDEVEALTGLDFFPELASLATVAVEAAYDVEEWPHDAQRYHRRLEHWNNQGN